MSFPIKYFSRKPKKKYIILIFSHIFSICNGKFPLWGYLRQFGPVSGGTGLIEIYAFFTKMNFYTLPICFYA